MKNLHLLPTDKQSKLYLDSKKNICITDVEMQCGNKQNIYITSDEEIKEGDWFIFKDDNTSLFQSIGNTDSTHIKVKSNNEYGYGDWNKDYCKKIILTTDPSLAPDVQKIDDEFLEWFVKNPSCEFVKVEVDLSKHNGQFQTKYGYKIIIPKEEPKQETLEEAAERLMPKTIVSEHGRAIWRLAFEDGAKWQQKRSYSEDEVLQLLRESHFVEQNIEEWFNQNKK